jgi:hypothetical protein
MTSQIQTIKIDKKDLKEIQEGQAKILYKPDKLETNDDGKIKKSQGALKIAD